MAKSDVKANAEVTDVTDELCTCSRFVPVTEAAALAGAEWVGRGDGLAGDQAARAGMAEALGGLSFSTRVVGGRMTASESTPPEDGPPLWDLAVSPLEGHDALARGLDGALSMLAAAPPGNIMAVPEMYMQKIAVSGRACEAIDMDAPAAQNLSAVADALGKDQRELTVAVLDRPRHEELIAQIKASGARLRLIDDGDVSASIAAAVAEGDIDMCIGIGGATEGVIAAAALRCLGGAMQARFWPVSRFQVEKLRSLGVEDVEAVLDMDDMAGDGVLVAVTAVTTGRFLRGVQMRSDGVRTETLIMCSRCNKISLVRTIHRREGEQTTPSLWTL